MLLGRAQQALIATAVAAALVAASVPLWSGGQHSPPATHHPTLTALVRRPQSAGDANWQAIKAAAWLRDNALQPRHTAFHRQFAAFMGLEQLMGLHPIRQGRCATAVSYLYDNLLDLRDAYTGEDWTPLRQAVATQPSLGVCAPRKKPPRVRVRYVS